MRLLLIMVYYITLVAALPCVYQPFDQVASNVDQYYEPLLSKRGGGFNGALFFKSVMKIAEIVKGTGTALKSVKVLVKGQMQSQKLIDAAQAAKKAEKLAANAKKIKDAEGMAANAKKVKDAEEMAANAKKVKDAEDAAAKAKKVEFDKGKVDGGSFQDLPQPDDKKNNNGLGIFGTLNKNDLPVGSAMFE